MRSVRQKPSGRRRANSSSRQPAIASTSSRRIPSWISVPTNVDHWYSTCGSGLPDEAREPYPSAIIAATSASQNASRLRSSLPCGDVAERMFTPAEANSALPEVRPVAERLVALRVRMRELERTQRELVTAIGGNGGGYAASDLNAAQSELSGLADAAIACVERLEELGVVVKDLDLGLLDFPAEHDGGEVLLCWHVGEDSVSFWHGLDEGYAGRKPIDWSE